MRRKDEYKYKVQKLISPALTLMVKFLTMADEASEKDAKLLCEAMYQCPVSRKLSRGPWFYTFFKRSEKKITPEATLYGPKLEKRMNKINKYHEKLLKNYNSDKKTVSGSSGNFRCQLAPQPSTNRQAYFNQGGSGRQISSQEDSSQRRFIFPKRDDIKT